MLKTIIGEDDFRRGMDLYFERFDGTAATVEDFLKAFADVTGPRSCPFLPLVRAGGNAAREVGGLRRGAQPTGSI
jgi:hypothetical protein